MKNNDFKWHALVFLEFAFLNEDFNYKLENLYEEKYITKSYLSIDLEEKTSNTIKFNYSTYEKIFKNMDYMSILKFYDKRISRGLVATLYKDYCKELFKREQVVCQGYKEDYRYKNKYLNLSKNIVKMYLNQLSTIPKNIKNDYSYTIFKIMLGRYQEKWTSLKSIISYPGFVEKYLEKIIQVHYVFEDRFHNTFISFLEKFKKFKIHNGVVYHKNLQNRFIYNLIEKLLKKEKLLIRFVKTLDRFFNTNLNGLNINILTSIIELLAKSDAHKGVDEILNHVFKYKFEIKNSTLKEVFKHFNFLSAQNRFALLAYVDYINPQNIKYFHNLMTDAQSDVRTLAFKIYRSKKDELSPKQRFFYSFNALEKYKHQSVLIEDLFNTIRNVPITESLLNYMFGEVKTLDDQNNLSDQKMEVFFHLLSKIEISGINLSVENSTFLGQLIEKNQKNPHIDKNLTNIMSLVKNQFFNQSPQHLVLLDLNDLSQRQTKILSLAKKIKTGKDSLKSIKNFETVVKSTNLEDVIPTLLYLLKNQVHSNRDDFLRETLLFNLEKKVRLMNQDQLDHYKMSINFAINDYFQLKRSDLKMMALKVQTLLDH